MHKDGGNKDNQRNHKVLIFQGGGAMGAYEAGVFMALHEKMFNENDHQPLFDVIAGASIGAVNAVILVTEVLKTGNWKDTAQVLKDFWLCNISNRQSPFNMLIDNPWTGMLWSGFWNTGKFFRDVSNSAFQSWLDYFIRDQNSFLKFRESFPNLKGYYLWPDTFGSVADPEAARRYYSYLETLAIGSPNVLNPSILQPDFKFGNPLSTLHRFDNDPLVQSLKDYWDFEDSKLKTISTDEKQPRLLLVSVDVTDCTHAVTFDSYRYNSNNCPLCEKPIDNPAEHLNSNHYNSNEYLVTDNVHCSVYGAEQNKQVLFYKGIEIDHLISSMSTHQRFKFPEFDVWSDANTKTRHPFWDGAYLSNTPLREVLQAHKDYWKNVSTNNVLSSDKTMEGKGETEDIKNNNHNKDIPSLEVYIVNLYPAIENNFQNNVDADTIQDREIDIKFHDRTSYDVKVAQQTTDYIDLVRGLRDLVDETITTLKKDSKTDQNIIENLEKKKNKVLSEYTRIKGRDGKRRKRRELIDNRFAVNKTVYIERLDDKNAIFGKAFDFSKKTVHELYKHGYCDAIIQYNLQYIQDIMTAEETMVNQDIKDKVEIIIQKFRAKIFQSDKSTKLELEELRKVFESNNLNQLSNMVDEIYTTLDEKCNPMC